MVNLDSAVLSHLILHQVGNKFNDEQNKLAGEQLELTEYQYATLFKFLLNPFINISEYFTFAHHSDITLNALFKFSTELFQEQTRFIEVSQKIANHLYDQSNYPQIKNGDVLVAYFEDIQCDEITTDAIGIYKIEKKIDFIRPIEVDGKFVLEVNPGINSQKLDKGCLVLLTDEEGYRVLPIDNNNYDANYWKRDFLSISPLNDNYHQTKNYLEVTEKFVNKHLGVSSEFSVADKAGILNKAATYFKNKDSFSEEEFARTTFSDDDLISSFRRFKSDYSAQNNLNLSEGFEISDAAFKKQSKILRKVIKLDKNFHVYVHGNSELIERGYDPSVGKHYYKIFFDNEN